MLITSIMGTIIGYLAIVSHLIKPASLIIPNEIPNFLLAFLGSNDGWTLILNTFIIFISIIVYSPFIKIQNSEVDYEK
jgi:PTS system cellobiose-specific IIC component